MPLRPCRLTPVLALLLAPSAVRGGDTPQTPAELAERAQLIVIGEVTAYGVFDEEHDDGSKSRWVTLRVRVESVVKGGAPVKPGDTIHVHCRALVRPAFDGTVPGGGHRAIPGNGGRAKFYCDGQVLGVLWPAITPTGIEPLDETPRLEFPIEPAATSPPGRRAGRWPLRLLVCATVAGLLLFASRRSRQRTAGANPHDRNQAAPASPR
jgi:hypothetical protein